MYKYAKMCQTNKMVSLDWKMIVYGELTNVSKLCSLAKYVLICKKEKVTLFCPHLWCQISLSTKNKPESFINTSTTFKNLYLVCSFNDNTVRLLVFEL